jgi:hypothetical protein
MTNPNDPWAAAANKVSEQAQNATPANAGRQDGGRGASAGTAAKPVSDMANPFKTSREVTPAGGGNFDPFVPYAYLIGRPVILIPKRFTDQDPKPAQYGGQPGEVRDKWTIDLVILGGEPFTFSYKTKENKDAPEVEKEMVVDTFPATFRGQSIWSGQLVAALNGANEAGAFVYGTWCRVPVREDERNGRTREKLEELLAQWRRDIAAGKPGVSQQGPRHSYNVLDDPDVWKPEYVNLAMAWWEQEKAKRLATGS